VRLLQPLQLHRVLGSRTSGQSAGGFIDSRRGNRQPGNQIGNAT
jgi:hypothetical protein